MLLLFTNRAEGDMWAGRYAASRTRPVAPPMRCGRVYRPFDQGTVAGAGTG